MKTKVDHFQQTCAIDFMFKTFKIMVLAVKKGPSQPRFAFFLRHNENYWLKIHKTSIRYMFMQNLALFKKLAGKKLTKNYFQSHH